MYRSEASRRAALLRDHLRRNHGVAATRTLRSFGYSDSAIARLVASGNLERRYRGVLVATSGPDCWEQRQAAACAWGGEGAASSGRSAGHLHRLEGIHASVHELLVPSARQAPRGLIVHRSRSGVGRIVTRDALPCTDIWRTLFDLATVVDERSLEIALDDALRKGLVRADRLQERLNALGTRGRRGHRQLRRLVEERLDSPASGSGLNSRLRRAFRHSSLPMPEVEFPIYIAGHFVDRPDFAYPEALLAIEAQSRKFHTGVHWARHNERLNDLTLHGWLVMHATWKDAEEDFASFLEHVRVVREKRLGLGRSLGLVKGGRAIGTEPSHFPEVVEVLAGHREEPRPVHPEPPT